MREFYTQEPKPVELFPLSGGQTDVIIRRNIKYRQSDPDEKGNVQDTWECEEAQFRYPAPLTCAQVEARISDWFIYAGADSLDALTVAKQTAVASLSATCNAVIRAGFDVELSDGRLHHFSLETTDQIMIAMLAGKVAAGQTSVPWHADGEECRFFPAADILTVSREMEALVTYHETYFNNLKHYVLAMGTLEEVNAATYGMDIPEKYQSEVMKAIMNSYTGGNTGAGAE